MAFTLLSALADDPALRSALRLVDKRGARKSARTIADSINAMQSFSKYEDRLIDRKRSRGSLPFKVERKYGDNLKAFYRGDFRRGIEAARDLTALLEKSGLNLVLSRHIQNTIVRGKFPLGATARESRRLLSQHSIDVASVARQFGLNRDLATTLTQVTTINQSTILSLKIISPAAIPNVTSFVPGVGLPPQDWGNVGGPPSSSLGIQAPVPVQKGLDMFIQDLVFTTDMTTTAYVASRMAGGVPRARPRRGSGARSTGEMGSVGSAMSGWAQVGCGLIILVGGIIQGSVLLIVGGIAAILYGLYLVLLEHDAAETGSFVDP